jgi:hypothetical protein
MDIRVAHCSCGNHTGFSFFSELLFQNLRGVALDLYIFKIMLDLITGASAIAINTAVGTTAIEVHAVFWGKNCVVIGVVHTGLPAFPAKVYTLDCG